MKPKNNKVTKALSPEEMTLVSNIESILQELMQMGGGAGGAVGEPAMKKPEAPEVPVMDADIPMTEEDAVDNEIQGKEIKMILKGIEQTKSDSSTASDSAEERLSKPLSEQDEENVNEVEKAVRVLLRSLKGNAIKKSKVENPLVNVLNKLVEVQKASQSQVEELSTAFAHVLEGIGIAKQINVVAKSDSNIRKVNKSQNDELLQVLKQLTGSKGNEKDEKSSQGNVVRKNLSNRAILGGLIGR